MERQKVPDVPTLQVAGRRSWRDPRRRLVALSDAGFLPRCWDCGHKDARTLCIFIGMDTGRNFLKDMRDWRHSPWNRWLVARLRPAETQTVAAESEQQSCGSPKLDQAAAAPPAKDPQQSSERAAPARRPRSTHVSPARRSHSASREPREPSSKRGSPPQEQIRLVLSYQVAISQAIEALDRRVDALRSYQLACNRRLETLSPAEATAAAAEQPRNLKAHVKRLEQRLARLEEAFTSSRGEACRDRHTRNSDAIPPPPRTGRQPIAPSQARRDSIYELFSASMRGSLEQLSVATLLGMLELEKRTGKLRLRGGEDVAVIWLAEGALVKCELNDRQAEPVELLRLAMRWQGGHFSFTTEAIDAVGGQLRSMGSLLIEATTLNDEASL